VHLQGVSELVDGGGFGLMLFSFYILFQRPYESVL
jgi:hypothetical protein